MDEAAARMLAQVLGERGLPARVVPHRAVSRAELGSLQSGATSMLCVCYLDLEGGVSHVRYLLRRLRRTLPDLPVLVGLWPTDAPALQDERARAAIGADHYVVSLQEAVDECLRLLVQTQPMPEAEPQPI